MWLSKEVFAALGHLNCFNNAVRQIQHNRSKEPNVAVRLTENIYQVELITFKTAHSKSIILLFSRV